MDKLEKAMEKARRQHDISACVGALPLSEATHHEPLSELLTADILSDEEDAQLRHCRILAHRQHSPAADAFRILRTQVLQIMQASGYNTLAITSPQYGDGKTTTALNLAISIALDLKQTVLLVDLDLRKPAISKCFGFEDAKGLTDCLMDDVPLADCFIHSTFGRLRILPGGRAVPNSSELLGTPKMAALARELKTRYRDRFVIYDMPPVLTQADPSAFLPHVDATLVVVRDGITRVDDLRTCMGRLSKANIIGTVLNNSPD